MCKTGRNEDRGMMEQEEPETILERACEPSPFLGNLGGAQILTPTLDWKK